MFRIDLIFDVLIPKNDKNNKEEVERKLLEVLC